MNFKLTLPSTPRPDYTEIGQQRPNLFSWVKLKKTPEYVEVIVKNHPVKCRDYLNDTIVWRDKKVRKPQAVYGYDYAGPIETKATVFALWDSNELLKNIDLLNSLMPEGIAPVKVSKVDDEVILVEGDKFFLKNTVNLSWYTYLLRLFTHSNINKVEDIEEHFMIPSHKNIYKKMIPALMKLEGPVCGSFYENMMHNYNGFYTALTSPQCSNYGVILKNALQSV